MIPTSKNHQSRQPKDGQRSSGDTIDLQFASNEVKVIGPSPQAAAMTRYADYPVSYCLGQADISIPLYEVKSRSLSLPISLSYNSSGVRVDDISGTAGLNWSLEAGGVITRTISGLPDEYYNGDWSVRPQVEVENNNPYNISALSF